MTMERKSTVWIRWTVLALTVALGPFARGVSADSLADLEGQREGLESELKGLEDAKRAAEEQERRAREKKKKKDNEADRLRDEQKNIKEEIRTIEEKLKAWKKYRKWDKTVEVVETEKGVMVSEEDSEERKVKYRNTETGTEETLTKEKVDELYDRLAELRQQEIKVKYDLEDHERTARPAGESLEEAENRVDDLDDKIEETKENLEEVEEEIKKEKERQKEEEAEKKRREEELKKKIKEKNRQLRQARKHLERLKTLLKAKAEEASDPLRGTGTARDLLERFRQLFKVITALAELLPLEGPTVEPEKAFGELEKLLDKFDQLREDLKLDAVDLRGPEKQELQKLLEKIRNAMKSLRAKLEELRRLEQRKKASERPRTLSQYVPPQNRALLEGLDSGSAAATGIGIDHATGPPVAAIKAMSARLETKHMALHGQEGPSAAEIQSSPRIETNPAWSICHQPLPAPPQNWPQPPPGGPPQNPPAR